MKQNVVAPLVVAFYFLFLATATLIHNAVADRLDEEAWRSAAILLYVAVFFVGVGLFNAFFKIGRRK